MPKKTTLSLILPAFGAALIVVLSQIVIPVGTVPFTLQTLAIGLIATLFRPREAVLSVYSTSYLEVLAYLFLLEDLVDFQRLWDLPLVFYGDLSFMPLQHPFLLILERHLL